MVELALFTLALTFPNDPQFQILLTMTAECAVLLIVLVCLPNLSMFKNIIHIVARAIDIGLLSYLFRYEQCDEMT